MPTPGGNKILSNGPLVREFEEKAAEYLGAKYAIATCSGTMALYIMYRALNLRGKRIAMPAYTWRSTAEAAIMAGARPIFFDVFEDNFCLNYRKLRDKVFDIIIVNDCFGHPADYEELSQFGVRVLSDSASAFGARYKGKKLGEFGTRIFSLSPTKHMTANEGGLITSNDESFADEAKKVRRWAGRMTEYNATCALHGLKFQADILEEKAEIAINYRAMAVNLGYSFQKQSGGVEGTNKDFVLVLNSKQGRDVLKEHLEAAGIETRIYFTPANLFLKPDQFDSWNLDVTERLWNTTLCLPSWPGVDQDYIIKVVERFYECQLLRKQKTSTVTA